MDIVFEIKEKLGTITAFDTGWNKELNIVAWNGNEPRFDIRSWDSVHERMSRGLTLSTQEAEMVYRLLRGYFQESE